MTQSYFPFASGAGSNVSQDQWQLMAQNWLATGVIKGALNELSVYADSTGMQCKVKSGQAWMKGHFFQSDAEEIQPIATADSTNPRIDRVILRVDWIADTIQLAVLQGVPAASPTPPALTQNSSRWEISLAQVSVAANATTIAAGNITDERFPLPYIAPTLFNNWVTNRAGSAKYWKDSLGYVHFYFELKNGSTALNTSICVLPDGYIPDDEYLFNGYCEGGSSTDALFHVTNSPAGEVKLLRAIGGNTLLVMQGMFKAAK